MSKHSAGWHRVDAALYQTENHTLKRSSIFGIIVHYHSQQYSLLSVCCKQITRTCLVFIDETDDGSNGTKQQDQHQQTSVLKRTQSSKLT